MVSVPEAFDADIGERIFVKGFPRETTEKDLMTFFETYGIVKSANIVKDHKSGLAKYAFVTFESKEIRDELCLKKSVKFQEKTLCIGEAKRNKTRSERSNSGSTSHEFRRYFPTRQPQHEYTSSTAPMAYYVYPFCNQNAMYVPAAAVQTSPIAPMPSPSYQSSYVAAANPAPMFTTLMPANSPSTSYVQSIGSEQYLLPMPRTTYVDGYVDYPSVPSIFTVPFSQANDWVPVAHTTGDGGANYLQKECTSPNVGKAKKTFVYGPKEVNEESEVEDSSHAPVAAGTPKDNSSQ